MPEPITVRGRHLGRDVALTWRGHGDVVGDRFAVADVEDLVASGREVGQAGIGHSPATLDADRYGRDMVMFTLGAVLDEVTSVEGVEPEDIPEGAQAG